MVTLRSSYGTVYFKVEGILVSLLPLNSVNAAKIAQIGLNAFLRLFPTEPVKEACMTTSYVMVKHQLGVFSQN